jgi:hypothetical protein
MKPVPSFLESAGTALGQLSATVAYGVRAAARDSRDELRRLFGKPSGGAAAPPPRPDAPPPPRA